MSLSDLLCTRVAFFSASLFVNPSQQHIQIIMFNPEQSAHGYVDFAAVLLMLRLTVYEKCISAEVILIVSGRAQCQIFERLKNIFKIFFLFLVLCNDSL